MITAGGHRLKSDRAGTRGSAGLLSCGFLEGAQQSGGRRDILLRESRPGESSVITGTVLLGQMAFMRPQFFPVLTHEGDDTFLLVIVGQSLRGYGTPAWVQRTFTPPGLTRLSTRGTLISRRPFHRTLTAEPASPLLPKGSRELPAVPRETPCTWHLGEGGMLRGPGDWGGGRRICAFLFR